MNPFCPAPAPKANLTECNGGREVCLAGVSVYFYPFSPESLTLHNKIAYLKVDFRNL